MLFWVLLLLAGSRRLSVLAHTCHLVVVPRDLSTDMVRELLRFRGHVCTPDVPQSLAAQRHGIKAFFVLYRHNDDIPFPTGVHLHPTQCPPRLAAMFQPE